MKIPFNYPHVTGQEIEYIKQVLDGRHLCGDGIFSKRCHNWLEQTLGCAKALLTPSGTAALEMAALILAIKPGDEVIMPSFTFVSTANAFALRGAQIVFVDITPDTQNIDCNEVAKAISSKTRAVVPVHYAGIACDMNSITALCRSENVEIVEDAAHAIMSSYDGKPLGSFGSLAALSFHETKNLVAGEAGALIINSDTMIDRAEIIREKGTDRSRFFRGQIDKYTWQELGSSYLPSELQAAFLWAQIENATSITSQRKDVWESYHEALEPLESAGFIRRPVVPAETVHNGHIYYILTRSLSERSELMDHLHNREIGSVFHYIPLHTAPGAKNYSRALGALPVTNDTSDRLLRLPMSVSLTKQHVSFIVQAIEDFFSARLSRSTCYVSNKPIEPIKSE